jgi:hypothetical protein
MMAASNPIMSTSKRKRRLDQAEEASKNQGEPDTATRREDENA